jgi:hypothetical protein
MSGVTTYAELLGQLQTIVDERPGYVYRPVGDDRMCRYADDLPGVGLVPGCLLGHWLHRFHHIDLERMAGPTFTGYNIERVLPDLIYDGWIDEFEDRIRMTRFLGFLQELQDAGTPWGQALREAQRRIDEAMPLLPEPVPA